MTFNEITSWQWHNQIVPEPQILVKLEHHHSRQKNINTKVYQKAPQEYTEALDTWKCNW